jgi:surface carbohydrate biosynthesis protein
MKTKIYKNINLVDIVIFHGTNFDILKNCLPAGSSYIILEPYSDIILNKNIIIKTLRNIFQIVHLTDLKGIRSISKLLLLCHHMAIMQVVVPKIAITFIHDCYMFQRLYHKYKSCDFFCIQNGMMTNYDLYFRDISLGKKSYIRRLPKFFCFGRNDIELHHKFGHTAEVFFPIGSMKTSAYFRSREINSKISNKSDPIKFDICFVSTWGPKWRGLLDGDSEDLRKSSSNIDQLVLASSYIVDMLQRLVAEENISLCIACRKDRIDEIGYYHEKFGNFDKCQILKKNGDTFATYDAIRKSSLTLSVESTVLFEALAWGSKGLICNPHDHHYFRIPSKPNWYFDKNDYQSFRAKCQQLLQLTEFGESDLKKINYYMNYNTDADATSLIRKELQKSIKKAV